MTTVLPVQPAYVDSAGCLGRTALKRMTGARARADLTAVDSVRDNLTYLGVGRLAANCR